MTERAGLFYYIDSGLRKDNDGSTLSTAISYLCVFTFIINLFQTFSCSHDRVKELPFSIYGQPLYAPLERVAVAHMSIWEYQNTEFIVISVMEQS
ncbi:hypothetical protein KDW_44260 [Dictyobacter vulcani]|uniref:Uncharacterized protein n=1 Tax=Dictyobacter vulcani TaxID=2607529 RepID=A0A5J4KLF6_9CHLR|nr:hypothetical protein KDW_44260 [Dictyobacter vulcani]